MRPPNWFWWLMTLWLFIGLPGLLIGAMWGGGFNPLPDPPPYLQAPYEDRSFGANASWAFAVAFLYLPVFLLPALGAWYALKRPNRDDS